MDTVHATQGNVLSFPNGFLWGSSTAAHQVEGNNTNNDWYQWEQAGNIKDKQVSGLACDHYSKFREDIDLMASMHHKAYRLSIEWSRIEPRRGEINHAAIAHYVEVLRYLKECGIRSFVTLHHFTSPTWFDWESHDADENLAIFAGLIARSAIGELVDFWIPINEPNVLANHGYLKGDFPPGRKSLGTFYRVLIKMTDAHNLARAAIKHELPNALVGTAKDTGYFIPADKSSPSRFASENNKAIKNHFFLDRIEADFIGINYYSPKMMRFSDSPESFFGKKVSQDLPTTDMGWLIYPEGLEHILKDMTKYGLPIYITENGLADATDHQRIDFIRDHVAAVHRAIASGVDVRGYLHWSFMDNFEWGFGYGPRFGLVEVNYETQERIPRPSAHWYANVCRDNQVQL